MLKEHIYIFQTIWIIFSISTQFKEIFNMSNMKTSFIREKKKSPSGIWTHVMFNHLYGVVLSLVAPAAFNWTLNLQDHIYFKVKKKKRKSSHAISPTVDCNSDSHTKGILWWSAIWMGGLQSDTLVEIFIHSSSPAVPQPKLLIHLTLLDFSSLTFSEATMKWNEWIQNHHSGHRPMRTYMRT